MSISVLNTDAQLSASTILTEEDSATIEGLHTFDRDPNAPFAVSSGSAVVSNLDADKLDGLDSTGFLLASNNVWTSVSFAAGNFTATGGGTWTVASGDQEVFKYRKHGTTLDVHVALISTTVAGTVTALNIVIPGGFTASRISQVPIVLFDNSSSVATGAYVRCAASGTSLIIVKNDATNFAAATDTTSVRFQIQIETTA
jgi:hypothetical protein